MKNQLSRAFLLGTIIWMVSTVAAIAQTAETVELVAYNKENQTVKDLRPDDIELKMDGRPIAVDSMKLVAKKPPRMILLFDSAYTALYNRSLLKDMVTAFIDLKPPQMEMALATINDVQQILSPFQESNDEIVSTLQKLKFGGSAPLSGSLLDAIARFDPNPVEVSSKTHKVLTVISDGSDDSPGSEWNQAMKAVVERNFSFYEVNHIKAMKVIFDSKFIDKDLIRLANETGGRAYRLDDLSDIGWVAREIFDRETNTYVVTLNPGQSLSPNDRSRFKVKSRRKDVKVEVVAVH